MAKVKQKVYKQGLSKDVFDEIKDIIWPYNFDWLAYRAKCCPATLYFWCDGTTKYPRLETVIKVLNAIDYKLVPVKGPKTRKLRVVK
jgi:hypothetical protein